LIRKAKQSVFELHSYITRLLELGYPVQNIRSSLQFLLHDVGARIDVTDDPILVSGRAYVEPHSMASPPSRKRGKYSNIPENYDPNNERNIRGGRRNTRKRRRNK